MINTKRIHHVRIIGWEIVVEKLNDCCNVISIETKGYYEKDSFITAVKDFERFQNINRTYFRNTNQRAGFDAVTDLGERIL